MLEQTLGLLEALLAVVALIFGVLVLSVVYAAIAGKQLRSLPFIGMIVAVVIGALIYPALGTPAIVIVLLHFAAWCLIAGLVERFRQKRALLQRGG